jgi:peptidoglycan/LPS O-acetylase OafA/YrhL
MYAIAALMAICFAYRIAISMIHTPLAATMTNWLPGYIGQFALGMALAVASAYIEVTATKPGWLWHPGLAWVSWGFAAACFIAVGNLGLPVSALGNGTEAASLAKQALYGAFGFFIVVPGVFGPARSGAIRALLSARVVAAVGVVSYGVYLWHQAWVEMILSWSNSRLFAISFPFLALSVTALALASAALSYVVAEHPILHGRWPLVGSWGLVQGGLARFSNPVASSPGRSVGASRIGPQG